MTAASLATQLDALRADYDALVARGLSLDLTRGKPSAAQLDLSNDLLDLPGDHPDNKVTGTADGDLRNYGMPKGLPALRRTFGDVLRVPAEQLLALGNSSLTVMHDVVAAALLHGVPGSTRPWVREERVSFLCPVPGYDRHFAITEAFGVRMIPIPLNDDGPDIAAVRTALENDPSIKGMWCVPLYSNPTGTIYSQEVAKQLVSLPAAADFRIFWDNAYAVHHISDETPETIDILRLAAEAGNPDRVFVFASTSKVTYPGGGVAFFGSSPANVDWLLERQSVQSIGPDKINHLRHALFLPDTAAITTHMRRHRDLIEPKFAAVQRIFTQRLTPYGVGSWTNPQGGYFVTLTVSNGCAKRAIQLAAEAGIAITPAGSPYPYRDDPNDAVIRIAPTFPPQDEVEVGLDGFCTALLLAEAEAAAGAGTGSNGGTSERAAQ